MNNIQNCNDPFLFGAVWSGLKMFARTGLFANNISTLQAQYWLMPKNRHTIFFYRYALAKSSMMHFHLQDLIKSEHLQIIYLFAYFTIKEISKLLQSGQLLFSFIYWHFYFKVWCLIIVIPMDEMRPPILLYRNYIITFFFHIFMHMFIFMLILFFSFAETGGIWDGCNALDLHWRSSALHLS